MHFMIGGKIGLNEESNIEMDLRLLWEWFDPLLMINDK